MHKKLLSLLFRQSVASWHPPCLYEQFAPPCDPMLRVPGAALFTASRGLTIWQIRSYTLDWAPGLKNQLPHSLFSQPQTALKKPVHNMLAWLMVFVISLSDSASNTPPTVNYSFNSYQCFIYSTSVVKWQSSKHFPSSSPTLHSFQLSKSFSAPQHSFLSVKACSRWLFLHFFGPFCSYSCLHCNEAAYAVRARVDENTVQVPIPRHILETLKFI